MSEGTIQAIHVASEPASPTFAVDEVRAVPGLGLEGDRTYLAAERAGATTKPENEVTLIESEALEALARDYGVELTGATSRRNLLTRGVALNHFVGRDFRVGETTLHGLELCEPCGHLERLTKTGVVKGLLHRGGLRARIVTGGVIRRGDSIRPA
jgi:MOSC domain-containing protein YiiM